MCKVIDTSEATELAIDMLNLNMNVALINELGDKIVLDRNARLILEAYYSGKLLQIEIDKALRN